MSIPSSHHAAQIHDKNGKYSINVIETPKPGPTEVLIKVSASGICASDHYAISGEMPAPYPMSPGHEVVGTIVTQGDQIDKKIWHNGKKVGAGWSGGYCTRCQNCRLGDFMHCIQGRVTGVNQQGGHQEYLIIDETALVNLSETTNMSDAELAPLLCAGLTVSDALHNSNAKAGDIVIIQGIGGLGHMAIQYANKMGFIVVACSSTRDKQNLAFKLGAHHYLCTGEDDLEKQMSNIGEAKAVIATAPSGKACQQLVPLLSTYGTLVIVGTPMDGNDLQVSTLALISKFIRIQGLGCGSAASNDKLVAWSDQVGVKAMVKEWPLERVQDAWDEVRNGKPNFRNVIVFD